MRFAKAPIAALFSASVWAQAPPVTIAETSAKAGERGVAVSLALSNNGGKPIQAYSFVCEHLDGKGKVVSKSTQSAIRGLDLDEPPVYAPDETWTAQVTVPLDSTGYPLRYRTALDYVLFQDGSTWGPDALKTSTHVRAVRMGANLERKRLQQILLRRGEKAVLDELRQ